MDASSYSRRMLQYVRERHPRSLAGVLEARAVDPRRFDEYAALFVGWATSAYGEDVIERMVDAFVLFSSDVNLAQARYEATGRYERLTYKESDDAVYSQPGVMRDYLLGVYLTNFMWAHHMELSLLFEDRFLPSIAGESRIIEIAPGHGGWGLWALHATRGTSLVGFDISDTAVDMARQLASAAQLSARASYAQRDAMSITTDIGPVYDACICSFLIEHLEDPGALLALVSRLVRPTARVFLTGALTAAQVDHVYEFRHEAELVVLAEQHGFRVLDMRSVGPRRTLPGARFLPRSAALILQKRTHETW
ncbi:MAG: class I SAM-dependent methyltransferase [Gemmatimonadaceae bacterium]